MSVAAPCRKDNVSSKAIRPTWLPFSSTISAEQRLAFSLHLMNGDWSVERTSNRYQLGETMHIQADVNTDNHVALRLFVDHCVATLSPDTASSPRYAVVDYHGKTLLQDPDLPPLSRGASLSPSVVSFQIYITCHLKVAAADQPLDPLNKACSFNKASNR
ncbi:hypothetical protein JD844_014308 [Phrynosoma platyrhinos]|uniref:ZP domain-containing protein n=1 Tax=Phrynosoma platyrhinos TaxID=52577 RepID=A0ABQ7SRE9_PHRPL|nr:hypothetical protein JD844_014308 [Phrynosoma platyrhinos]